FIETMRFGGPVAPMEGGAAVTRTRRQTALTAPQTQVRPLRAIEGHSDPGIRTDAGCMVGVDLLIILIEQILDTPENLDPVRQEIGRGDVHEQEVVQRYTSPRGRIDKFVIKHPAVVV